MAASAERIRESVEAYVRLVESGSADEIVALFAEDATVEDPVGSEVRSGHESLREFYGGLTGLERKTRLFESRVAAGEAAFYFEIVTRVGDATYTLAPMEVMTFDDDGLITSMRAFWDPADMVSA